MFMLTLPLLNDWQPCLLCRHMMATWAEIMIRKATPPATPTMGQMLVWKVSTKFYTDTLKIIAKFRCDLYPAEVPHKGGDAGARVDHHHDLGGGQGGAGRALYSHLQPRVLRDVAHIWGENVCFMKSEIYVECGVLSNASRLCGPVLLVNDWKEPATVSAESTVTLLRSVTSHHVTLQLELQGCAEKGIVTFTQLDS